MSDPNVSGERIVSDLLDKIYGPKFCARCNQVQPVNVVVLAGSEWSELDGTVYKHHFTGSYQCRVCLNTIEEPNPRLRRQE